MDNPEFARIKKKTRKGLDKPIFVIAALALAMMFLAVYFSSVSGWLGDMVTQFNNAIAGLG